MKLPPNSLCILTATVETYGAQETLYGLGEILGEYVLGTRPRARVPQELHALSAAARKLNEAGDNLKPKVA